MNCSTRSCWSKILFLYFFIYPTKNHLYGGLLFSPTKLKRSSLKYLWTVNFLIISAPPFLRSSITLFFYIFFYFTSQINIMENHLDSILNIQGNISKVNGVSFHHYLQLLYMKHQNIFYKVLQMSNICQPIKNNNYFFNIPIFCWVFYNDRYMWFFIFFNELFTWQFWCIDSIYLI
jgi:hypothetical protein